MYVYSSIVPSTNFFPTNLSWIVCIWSRDLFTCVGLILHVILFTCIGLILHVISQRKAVKGRLQVITFVRFSPHQQPAFCDLSTRAGYEILRVVYM